jgi:hypothetical protein
MIPIFDKEVLNTIEKIIGIPFVKTFYEDGAVCFANNDEVRPDFRQSFTIFHVLDYINAIIYQSKRIEKINFFNDGSLEVPYPKDLTLFWNQVAIGEKLRKSGSLEHDVIEKYFDIKWYSE